MANNALFIYDSNGQQNASHDEPYRHQNGNPGAAPFESRHQLPNLIDAYYSMNTGYNAMQPTLPGQQQQQQQQQQGSGAHIQSANRQHQGLANGNSVYQQSQHSLPNNPPGNDCKPDMMLTPPGSPEDGVRRHPANPLLSSEITSQITQSLGLSVPTIPGAIPRQSPGIMATMAGVADPSIAPAIARALNNSGQRRPRQERKALPDDAKDERYFERRKRNNVAAKRSRDVRKRREDDIAVRASFLEKENAILRAQVATLREEANSLRQLLLQKRSRP